MNKRKNWLKKLTPVGEAVLDRLAGRPNFIERGTGPRDYSEIIETIKKGASDFFKEHRNIEFQKDSEHILWIVCLDCRKQHSADTSGMWTHCDFCKRGEPRLREAYLDFGCRKCK